MSDTAFVVLCIALLVVGALVALPLVWLALGMLLGRFLR